MASNPPADPRSQQLLRAYAVLTGINKLIVRERDPAILLQNACAIAVRPAIADCRSPLGNRF